MNFWRRSVRTSRRETVRNEINRENGYKNTVLGDIWIFGMDISKEWMKKDYLKVF
jgi:hypothetical protein